MASPQLKRFSCPKCQKSFNHQSQLVIHERSHTGEKPFLCIYCKKGFASSKVLKVHERKHTGEKPFKCPFCEKRFAAYANLVVHRRIHTNERPYGCRLCGRCFEHSGNLNRHFRAHIIDSGFRCILCSQIFNEELSLLQHTKIDHTNEYETYISNYKPKNNTSQETISEISNFVNSPVCEFNFGGILPNLKNKHSKCRSRKEYLLSYSAQNSSTETDIQMDSEQVGSYVTDDQVVTYDLNVSSKEILDYSSGEGTLTEPPPLIPLEEVDDYNKNFHGKYEELEIFKQKVVQAMELLLGTDVIFKLGYPVRNCEQILIYQLDMANKDPCVDIRINELERLQINTMKWIEHRLPDISSSDQIEWHGKPIEYILDHILNSQVIEL